MMGALVSPKAWGRLGLLALLLLSNDCTSAGTRSASQEDEGGQDAARSKPLFHAVFPVECKLNFLLWQTVGLWHSFRKAKQPGSFTRLLACAEERREEYRLAGAMDVCPTHITPSYTNYSEGDSYGPVSELQCSSQ